MNRPRTTVPGSIASLVAALTVACGGGDSGSQNGGPDFGEMVDAARDEAVNAEPSGEAVEGEVSFEVDGVPYAFDHLPAEETYYLSMASAVNAKPDPDAPEEFLLTVMSIDLEGREYPAELPPPEAGTSHETAMMVVGFSFTNAEGEEWAGPGRLLVDSFDSDGRLVASFTDVELSHTDNAQRPVTLTNGRIRARLR